MLKEKDYNFMQGWNVLRIVYVSFLITSTLQASDRGKEKIEEEERRTYISPPVFRTVSLEEVLLGYQNILIPLLDNPSAFSLALIEEIPEHFREEVIEALKVRGYLKKEGSTSGALSHNIKALLESSFADALQINASEEKELKQQKQSLFKYSFLKSLADVFEASHSSHQTIQDILKSKRAAQQSTVIPIFVMGSPRSGTTLIGHYIGSCSKVYDLIEYPGCYLALKVGPSFQKKIKAEYKTELYDAMFDFVTLFSADLIKKQGCEAYVDSNPFNLKVIKKLQDKIGPAIFVIMLRDYRGVISSLTHSYKEGYSWAGANDRERAELYYNFYKRLKDIDLKRAIFLNYDQLCANPDDTLNKFDNQLYERLETLHGVQTSRSNWNFDRRVLGQSHAPTYSISRKKLSSNLPRAFSMKEKKGTISLLSIASYNIDEWSSQREMEVYEWVSKIAQKLINNNIHKINHDNSAFVEFYRTLKSLKEKYKGNGKLLTAMHQNLSPRIWNVPLHNSNFIGREAFLKDLHVCLQKHKNSIYTPVIGMPGVGKTQLVKKYAELYKANYHLVWWFKGTTDLNKQYKDLAQALNNTLAFWNQGVDESLRLEKIKENPSLEVKDWLRRTSHPWLLIFDDMLNKPDNNDLPENHTDCGHIIVTSKNSNGWISPLQLKVFERFESIKLLKKFTDIKEDKNNANILAELLGDFPLALAQAAAYIGENRLLYFQEYTDLYKTKRKELEQEEEELRRQDKPIAYDSYNATIAVTFNLALEEIQKNSPEAFNLLTLCAFIDKRDILEEILENWLSHKENKSIFAFRNAIRYLMKYSLIEKENNIKKGEEGTVLRKGSIYALHELVQMAAQDKIFLTSPLIAEEVVIEICKYFASKSKYLFSLNFKTLEAHKTALSYFSHLVSLINHAQSLYINHDSLDELKWIGQILLLNGFELKASAWPTPDDSYVYLLALTGSLFDSKEEKISSNVKVLNKILQIAENSNPLIQTSIGTMFFFGRMVDINYQEAMEWYWKAAKQGNGLGQLSLAIMYDKGLGAIRNHVKARKWYQKAADQGNANAQYNLGCMYDEGEGGNQDHNEARKWYRKAAKQGFPAAQYNLGLMHHIGQGGDQNYEKARKLFKKAAKQGFPAAQYKLGLIYNMGEGVNQDTNKAKKLFKQAANQGDADAQFTLGMIYYHGHDSKQRYEKAVNWFKKAAEQGHVEAQYSLSLIYVEYQSDEQNDEKTGKWYQKAAGYKDVVKPQYNTEPMSAVDPKCKKMKEWLEEVAERGDVDAQYYLGMIYNEGIGGNQDFAQARKWFEKAAKQGDAEAQYYLIMMDNNN